MPRLPSSISSRGISPNSCYKNRNPEQCLLRSNFGKVILAFAILALFFGISFSWMASSAPDGLEWSIANVTGSPELTESSASTAYAITRGIQKSTALMPDYDTSFAGIIGGILVVTVTLGITSLLRYKKKIAPKRHE